MRVQFRKQLSRQSVSVNYLTISVDSYYAFADYMEVGRQKVAISELEEGHFLKKNGINLFVAG